MSDLRPDPDALLAQIESDAEHRTRGRLKIFFGAAPGVGKTYAMLEAARKLAAEGEDMIVGYIEPHVRRETLALVLGLDLLPKRQVEHRGAVLQEFDLEGALQRRPMLMLVDELAHTNAPGSTNSKRWQDVEQLLDAGINVFTTLNVQHLESLNDVIARITGIVVRETVPDAVFDGAHEVELVDIAPDDLIERLREGKVYVAGQASRAIENFFKKGNLFALRELALRRMAERVGAQVQGYRQAHAIPGTWQTSERLLVCVSPSPLSGRLVRAARRMASSLNAPWTAVYIETPATWGLQGAAWERLQKNLLLAERLGAQTVTLSGVNVVEELLHYARRQNVTKILVSKPREPRWKEVLRGSFVYQLTRECGDIDVYVISGEADEASPRGDQAPQKRTSNLPYLWAALTVAACTGVRRMVSNRTAPVNVIMLYLIGVVLVSLRFGQGPSVLASVLAVAAFDFFFIEPRMTFAVADTEYLFTFAVMLATGLVISTLTSRVKMQADLARRREQRTSALYSLTKALSGLLTVDDVVRSVVRDTGAASDALVIVLLPDPSKGLAVHPSPGGFTPSERDFAVAGPPAHGRSGDRHASFGRGSLRTARRRRAGRRRSGRAAAGPRFHPRAGAVPPHRDVRQPGGGRARSTSIRRGRGTDQGGSRDGADEEHPIELGFPRSADSFDGDRRRGQHLAGGGRCDSRGHPPRATGNGHGGGRGPQSPCRKPAGRDTA